MAIEVTDGQDAQPDGEVASELQNMIDAFDDRKGTISTSQAATEENSDKGDSNIAEHGTPSTDEPHPEEKPKDKPKLSWEMKRIHEETNKRREAEREAARLKDEIESLRKYSASAGDRQPETREEVSTDPLTIRRQIEAEMREEIWRETEAKKFEAETERVLKAGIEEVENFEDLVGNFSATFQSEMLSRPDFFEAIIDVPNGHKVYAELAQNPEEAERIFRLPPVKMALEIAKMSDKQGKPTTAAPKPISKAPPPITPIGGNTKSTTNLDDPNTSMDKFADTFLRDLAKKVR